jgi:molybdate transport system substrate-binding protein
MLHPTRTLAVSLSALGLILTACGSSAGTAATTTATPVITAAPTTTAASTTVAPTTVPSPTGSIVVFAASSLTDAFKAMGDAFTAKNPNAKVTFNFAGSSDLVTQIANGAPADVFVSADESNMKKVTNASENTGDPVIIARNSFEIIVGKGNPKGITGLADLAKPDTIVVLCAAAVPCGKGAATILSKAGITLTPKSLEDKVKGVVTKVTAGEADAGIVFVTDVKAAGAAAAGVEIPDASNVISKYPIVVTKAAPNPATATAFIDFVTSAAGQAILAKFGFLAP